METAKKQRPDLILLDINMPINMPKINAYEVYLHLQSQVETVNIPIIFIEILEQITDKINGFKITKRDHITKSFQESDILSQMQNKLIVNQRNRELITYKQQSEKAREEYKLVTKALVMDNHNLYSGVLLNAMTSTANRVKFDEYLNLEWQKLASKKLPLSLLLCNFDFSQNQNHADASLTADNCLPLIAREIKLVVKRSTDLVSRYEQEKFAIILSNTDSKGAVFVAKLIQERVDKLKINNIPFTENKLFILTIGVATIVPNKKMTPSNLTDMVEKAIDNAKLQGIN
ncbi:diguanylate cyclase domain-containing protein [Anabaena sp. UHCC 0451]|uniref:diguanylate cyclase domain-containing protein n=1 Tax=Anabaena sp. UHCC 0451 TaxID=2055235 RepID=UPI002B20B711|nr:diguanylate cyclase [Anabaena sp. UHCC 0451]MEA5577420.1 diguanylate cyclase [Anabaena sp. UHCC 0451]